MRGECTLVDDGRIAVLLLRPSEGTAAEETMIVAALLENSGVVTQRDLQPAPSRH